MKEKLVAIRQRVETSIKKRVWKLMGVPSESVGGTSVLSIQEATRLARMARLLDAGRAYLAGIESDDLRRSALDQFEGALKVVRLLEVGRDPREIVDRMVSEVELQEQGLKYSPTDAGIRLFRLRIGMR